MSLLSVVRALRSDQVIEGADIGSRSGQCGRFRIIAQTLSVALDLTQIPRGLHIALHSEIAVSGSISMDPKETDKDV